MLKKILAILKGFFASIFANLILKVVYPNRKNIRAESIEGKLFLVEKTVGTNDILLEGTYTYKEVVELNSAIGCDYEIGFGYCEELGSIAFIGIPNSNCSRNSGYFHYRVQEYGTFFECHNQLEYYFNAYTDEEAKTIENYTVYVFDIFRDKIAKVARISKINSFWDSRSEVKRAERPKVLDMDCMLWGTYSYKEAKLLSTGTTEEKEWFYGEEHPIDFAIVGGSKYVGIINMHFSKDLARGFRDVWEYGKDEPEIQTIEFLTDEEASKIDDFTLYVYDYSTSGNDRDKYDVIKRDRTLDPRFDFHLPDGSDYRLIEHTELFREE